MILTINNIRFSLNKRILNCVLISSGIGISTFILFNTFKLINKNKNFYLNNLKKFFRLNK